MSRFARSAAVVGGVLAVVALVVWFALGGRGGDGVSRVDSVEEAERAHEPRAVELAAAPERIGDARQHDASEVEAAVEVVPARAAVEEVPARAEVSAPPPLSTDIESTDLPDGVTAIVVRGVDGSSLAQIAAARGREPLHMFGSAFMFAVSSDFADESAFDREFEGALGQLQKPGNRKFEFDHDVVATLEVRGPTPVYLGVALHGVTLGWNVVAPGDRESVFLLPSNAFDVRLATIVLRLVDAPGGKPVRDARVTLRAEHSKQRRPDQSRVAPDEDGRVELTEAVPGEYELLVESESSQWNERVVLAPGEQRDFGDIVLAPLTPIEITTLNIKGAPIEAWIEIAPFDTGIEVEELFPPNLNKQSVRGVYRLLAPTQPSIVRARVIGEYNADTRLASAIVVLDPRLGLPATLELRLDTPVRFLVESRNSAIAKVHVRDAAGLLLELRDPSAGTDASPGLPPGTSTAELVDASGAVLAQQSFTLAAGEQPRVVAFE
jgi:hypothetical protein